MGVSLGLNMVKDSKLGQMAVIIMDFGMKIRCKEKVKLSMRIKTFMKGSL